MKKDNEKEIENQAEAVTEAAEAENTACEESAEDILKKQLAEAEDKYLRLAAEFDNYKKRTAKEREAANKYAVADTVSKLLATVDNLERAANASIDNAQAYADGVALVLKGFMDALTAIGVSEIPGEGSKFDPELHNAVMSAEAESEEQRDTVVAVFQKGYILGDKVIRHAMVKVAN